MKHSGQEVTIAKFARPINSIDIIHVEAIAIFTTKEKLSFCEAQKKRQGISSCIPKKIMIQFNRWGLFAPIHDFLFNPKTAFRY
ncbi:hypothetical protein [Okeania sp. KiyG1]|uniref:hypothetical protein n=1 Tax=Okeania sp. KiyG1 TaxID=2720165 RepID=UPI001923AAA6|nr:hypothetical protein [Okeania sp. KiyG1]